MHGYKSKGQGKIHYDFLLFSTDVTLSKRNSTCALDFLLPPLSCLGTAGLPEQRVMFST